MKPPIGTAFDITRDWAESLPIPLTHDQFQRMNDLQSWIAAAIAAAAQAEREACAAICDIRIERIKGDNMFPAFGLDGMLYEAERIAAAIRARNGDK